MTASHTPGPWTAHPSKYHEGVHIVQAGRPSNRVLARFGSEDEPLDDTDLANARLIAAAPDLLAALQSLHSFVAVRFGRGPDAVIPETIDTHIGVPIKIGEIMREAAAAVAKATGEK